MHLLPLTICTLLTPCLASPFHRTSHETLQSLERRQYGEPGQDDPYSGNHRWIPASQIRGASRTSCPFLNTAANHGFLPRDGRQISIAQFDQSIVDSINFEPNFAHAITMAMLGKLGVTTNDTEQNAALRIDLEQTNVHDKTEHDASVTRLDLSQGDNKNVQLTLVQDFLDDTVPFAYGYLNTSSVGRTRVRREKESLALGNPPLADKFFQGAQGEAGLILTTMDDNSSPITSQNADYRRAPKERVRSWLVNERFPTEQGFRRPSRVITQQENGFIVQGIAKWQASMSDIGSTTPSTNGYYVKVDDPNFGLH
jgi:hypothetical protein